MSHDRNASDSHTSFQPRNVASTSTWWRAIRSRRSVVLVGNASGGDAVDRAVLDEDVRGEQREAGDGMAATCVEQGDRRAVAVADEDRPLDAESLEQRRQHVVGLVVHVADRSRLGYRVAAPVAVAGVDDRSPGSPVAARTSSGNDRQRSIEPEPFVEEHQRRALRRRIAGRLDAHVERAAADDDALPAQGAAASCSRRANRRTLPVAVRGSWSTTTMRRGRLNAAICARQWASIAAASMS